MRNFTNLRIISLTTLSLSLAGCGNETPQTTQTSEVKPPATVVTNTHENIATGGSQNTNSLTIAGIDFNLTVQGTIAPNAVLDVSIVQTSGVPPTAIRVWVGDKSGVGSMKTRVHSHGARSHAHAQAPATLPADSALWIEIQNADGTIASGFINLG